ncbi:hypothetical protein ANN_19841 [Periplaneta americana]|uniref:Uncharacterized protein n=1 Tax=Periplaneta americana TaxID=6978 RepID=A0ABQ8SAZ3_PERAM|nr:hypothetical protein ANN_19841 [Periplaneta americana]
MEEERNWPPYPIISWLSCLIVGALLVSLVRFRPVFGQLTKQLLILQVRQILVSEDEGNCAAQQLNASQSTHRFSFVNHTIKTVNMPKVRHSVNLKSKLTSYISEFKEDGLSTDKKILFCNLCQCAVSSTQKFLVQQHITTSKHQANKQLNSKQRQLFLTQPTTSNLFNDVASAIVFFGVDGIADSKMVFGEMRPRISYRLPDIRLTVRKNLGKTKPDDRIIDEMRRKWRVLVKCGKGTVVLRENPSTTLLCPPQISSRAGR